MKLTTATLVCALGLTATASASATVVPLSAIPAGSNQFAPASGDVQFRNVRASASTGFYGAHSFLTALDSTTFFGTEEYAMGGEWAFYKPGEDEHVVVEELVPGDAPFLMRTKITATENGALQKLGVARIPLKKLAERDGVAVYAYRRVADVRLLVPRGFAGGDTETRGGRLGGVSEIIVRLPGGSAEDVVPVPHALPEKARWYGLTGDYAVPFPPAPATASVHVSVSQSSRDPEPIVSVAIDIL